MTIKHPPDRRTRARFVVRKGGFGLRNETRYLGATGAWVARHAAKTFSSNLQAEKFYREHHAGEDFGIFPA